MNHQGANESLERNNINLITEGKSLEVITSKERRGCSAEDEQGWLMRAILYLSEGKVA